MKTIIEAVDSQAVL